MAPTTPLGAYPYPAANDAPAAAADMMALAMAIDSKATLTAVDAADRDDRYSTAPTGALVVSGAAQSVWLKAGDGNNWITIYEDTGEVTTGFNIRTGWELGGYCSARRVSRLVQVRAEFIRTGDTIETVGGSTPGNIANEPVVDVPPAFGSALNKNYVVGSFLAGRTSGGCLLNSAGNLILYDIHTNATIEQGEPVRFHLMYFS